MQNFEDYVKLFPQYIQDIVEESKLISERKDFHPEPTLYDHIKICWERAKTTNDPNLMCAALVHDLGKVVLYKKYGHSRGHDKVSCSYLSYKYDKSGNETNIRQFIVGTLNCDYNCVYTIVEQHMRISKIDEMRYSKQKQLKENKYYDYMLRYKDIDNMLIEKEKW